MKSLQTYLLRIIAVSVMISLLNIFSGSDKGKKMIGYSGSLLLLLVVISPLKQLDAETLAQSITKIQMQQLSTVSGVELKNRELQQKIIKQELETYVIQKAEDQNMCVSIDITLVEAAEYPYPSSVVIVGVYSDKERDYLSQILAADLSIPPDKQEWIRS